MRGPQRAMGLPWARPLGTVTGVACSILEVFSAISCAAEYSDISLIIAMRSKKLPKAKQCEEHIVQWTVSTHFHPRARDGNHHSIPAASSPYTIQLFRFQEQARAMKNFNFPQEHNEHQRDARRGHRSRRHNEPSPPNGDGDFTDPRENFPGDEGRGRGGRGGFGPRGGGPHGGGMGPGFGGGPRGGFGGRSGFGPRGGGRVRKGNVRSAILSLLSQHSYNGYGMIGAIAAHTDGAWRPSPGSIYPALAALQSEGLIESTGDGKRTEFVLTDAGKSYVAENGQEMAQVWADVNEEAGAGTDLRQGLGKLIGAVEQISMAGTEDQIKAATEALDTARRAIYTLLAD